MALAPTLLTSGGLNKSPDDAAGYTTASITPGANKLILLAVSTRTPNGTQPTSPSVSGCGLTWVLIAEANFDASGSTDRSTVSVYRAMGASPTTGAVTIGYGATVTDKADWSIVEFAGADTTGTNGSGAIVQSAIANVNAASVSVTLAAFADATNNAGYLAVGHFGQEAFTPEAGWTELADEAVGSNNSHASAWRLGQDTSPSGSWATSARGGGVAMEIKAAAASSTPVVATRVVKWEARQAVLASRVLRWESRATVQAARALRWDALSSSAVIAARVLRWEARSGLLASRVLRWQARSNLTVSRGLRWEARAPIVAARVLRYAANAAVAASRVLRWQAGGTVLAARTVRFTAASAPATGAQEGGWMVAGTSLLVGEGGISLTQRGRPLTASGALCVEFAPRTHDVMGWPHTANGKIAVGAGPIVRHVRGLPVNADGQVIVVDALGEWDGGLPRLTGDVATRQ